MNGLRKFGCSQIVHHFLSMNVSRHVLTSFPALYYRDSANFEEIVEILVATPVSAKRSALVYRDYIQLT